MKRKKLTLVFLVAYVLVFVVGCGSENQVMTYENTDREIVTITFFGNKYDTENVEVIEEIISGFMLEHPDIHVAYESLKGTDYFDALRKRMAAGKGDDIFMVNHDAVLELKSAGQLADLSGLPSIPDYTVQMLGQMTETDGRIYWVPTTVSAFGLYCNMDLLKAHGQIVPGNLTEWEAVCDYFLAQGITPVIANHDISLKTLAIGTSLYTYYQEESQMEVFARLNQGQDKLSDYLSEGFAFVDRFIEKGYIDAAEALHTDKTSDDLAEFAKGEAPFMLTGAWAVAQLKGLDPQFTFQVFPYPVLEDGALEVINADTRLCVNAGSKHREAAMAFVEYFTRAENIQKFADQQASFSPLICGEPSSAAEIQPLLSCYMAGRTVIGADGGLNLPIWDLTAEVSRKLLSGVSLEASLQWMDQQAQEQKGQS